MRMASANGFELSRRNHKNGIKAVSHTALDIHPTKRASGSVMSFHNVSYTVKIEKMCCGSFRAAEPKDILHEVSGVLRPGLNAIMGSTGSGKSTLLDVLANRKDPDCISGKIYLDGKPIPKNFQYISGYVKQNDLFVGTVTVREALWFCANLRLPKSVTKKEKAAKIDKVLKDLALEPCADTKIGSDLIRGISGGEKKRTSIATELILEPQILFLDEPTTGLDAATAWSVLSLLKRLANQGHTIVCSIHQPRYGIYKLFDNLTLLSKGHLVYQGAANGTLNYFEKLGYICERHDNPADFYLDVLNGGHERVAGEGDTEGKGSQDKVCAVTDSLKNSFVNSSLKQDLDHQLQSIESNASDVRVKAGRMYETGFWQQLKVLLDRSGKNMIRNPQMLLGNALINIIIALVFGLIYLQVPDTPDKGVQNRLGVIFFLCTNMLFASTFVIDNFIKEREIFVHEHVSGYYSVGSYYLSKLLADLIPLRTIAPIAFTLITYWMVGLKPEVGAVFIFFLVSLMGGFAAVGIGLFYSATFSLAVGNLVMVLTFICTILFSGLLVNLDEMADWLSWLQYLSVTRYGLVAYSVNEFRGMVFTECGNATGQSTGSFGSVPSADGTVTYENGTICRSVNGETFLHNTLSIGSSADDIDDWDLWQNIVALGCISVGLYILTYIQLARKKMYS